MPAPLAMLGDGSVVMGGSFTTVDGAVSPYLVRESSTCPATAVPAGSGCSGPGGALALAATALP